MWDAEIDVVVAGAGGCGLVAALAAAEQGIEVGIFEKTEFVLGNTAASAGMIPASNTRFQKEAGIYETAEEMAEDILRKNHYESDPELTLALCRESGPLVEWMADVLELPLSLVKEFKYPGQRNYRMHAPPSRSGLELIRHLKREVSKRDNIHLMLKSELADIIVDEDGSACGVVVQTPDGLQRIGAKKVILATNGFGANRAFVRQYIPEIADALYFGYEANSGDALRIGQQIGATAAALTAYQGHAAVAASHGILVTWGTIMMGGMMVNQDGRRFGNEAQGYSEFAMQVLRQPGQRGYLIFDEAIFQELLSIEDFKKLAELEAFKKADAVEQLAVMLHINSEQCSATVEAFNHNVERVPDEFGRISFPRQLAAPFYGIEVSPALFHTQGGLQINVNAQVLSEQGEVIANLYAGGGAAVGVSGNHAYGYMSGNGLLAALGFGRIAGMHAAKAILQEGVEARE